MSASRMGARGASASSEAADVVILVDRLDRVADAIVIAKRARRDRVAEHRRRHGDVRRCNGVCRDRLAVAGAGALTQEAIDVAVILNALRALGTGEGLARRHAVVGGRRCIRSTSSSSALDRLREIADALDDAAPRRRVALIGEANAIVGQRISPSMSATTKAVSIRSSPAFLPTATGSAP